jgi:hypothetical protein
LCHGGAPKVKKQSIGALLWALMGKAMGRQSAWGWPEQAIAWPNGADYTQKIKKVE